MISSHSFSMLQTKSKMENVKHILIIDGEIPTSLQLHELDNIIEDLKIKTYVENDGIGSYEFWGFKGFDYGKNYLSIDYCQDLELTIIFKTQLNEDLETYIKEEIIGNLDTTRHVTLENRLTEETELEADFKLVPVMNLKNKDVPNSFTRTNGNTTTLTLTWSDEE